ncbi:MAG: zinc-ribbon domain-containing protein [Planctomycetota bacterium]|nr:zinc-ribbon domain-containing protein [Planctomycetota bacterium]
MPICSACQKEIPADARFCPYCGNQPQPSACACGAALREGALFCTQCGKPVSKAANAPSPTPLSAPPPRTFPQPPPAPGMVPPPPLPAAAGVGPTASNLPPPAAPWDFQTKLKPTADSLVQSLQGIFPANTSAGKIAERMVRGALADPQVYRQAAEDETQNQEAMIAIAVAALASAALPCLILGGFSPFRMLALAIAQAASFAASIGIIHFLSPQILGCRLTFYQTLRSLAYAIAPLILSFVPLIGQIVGLWCIVTVVCALRAVSGCDAVKAAIALIFGGIGGAIAYSFAFAITRVLL